MRIFICHSTVSNYKQELYAPLKNSELAKKHELIFPYDPHGTESIKDIIRDCDLVLAEVSNPTFEQGLQLGWASASYVSTVCFYKTGTQVSPFLKDVTEIPYPYDSIEDMSKKIQEVADAL